MRQLPLPSYLRQHHHHHSSICYVLCVFYRQRFIASLLFALRAFYALRRPSRRCLAVPLQSLLISTALERHLRIEAQRTRREAGAPPRHRIPFNLLINLRRCDPFAIQMADKPS